MLRYQRQCSNLRTESKSAPAKRRLRQRRRVIVVSNAPDGQGLARTNYTPIKGPAPTRQVFGFTHQKGDNDGSEGSKMMGENVIDIWTVEKIEQALESANEEKLTKRERISYIALLESIASSKVQSIGSLISETQRKRTISKTIEGLSIDTE